MNRDVSYLSYASLDLMKLYNHFRRLEYRMLGILQAILSRIL